MSYLRLQAKTGSLAATSVVMAFLLSLSSSCSDNPEPVDQEVPVLMLRSPQLVQQNALVDFDATGSTDDWGIVRFSVEYGDGSSAQDFTSTHFSHRYDSPGTFSLVLRAFDDAGHVATMHRHVTVVEHLWPPYCAEDAGLTCTDNGICDEGLCFVVGESSDADAEN